jgi:hypothetical protein
MTLRATVAKCSGVLTEFALGHAPSVRTSRALECRFTSSLSKTAPRECNLHRCGAHHAALTEASGLVSANLTPRHGFGARRATEPAGGGMRSTALRQWRTARFAPGLASQVSRNAARAGRRSIALVSGARASLVRQTRAAVMNQTRLRRPLCRLPLLAHLPLLWRSQLLAL